MRDSMHELAQDSNNKTHCFEENSPLVNHTCCIFSKFNDGLDEYPLSSAKTRRCFFLECPSLVNVVGRTRDENAECFDRTVTLPGGLELRTSGPLLLPHSSLISSSLDELSFPEANCCNSLWAFTWDHFRFSGAPLSLRGISIGKKLPLLSPFESLSVNMFSFAASSSSPAKAVALIFSGSSCT